MWIFSGKSDSVVVQGVVDKTAEYYAHYKPASQPPVYVNSINAEHAWISGETRERRPAMLLISHLPRIQFFKSPDSYGNNCSYLGDPYINNCNYTAVHNMLSTILPGPLAPPKPQDANNLLQFDQTLYVPLPAAAISLGKEGYIYVPQACANRSAVCRLHVAFHGCLQDLGTIGETFVQQTGLNGERGAGEDEKPSGADVLLHIVLLTEYAESNNLVILYPQVARINPLNPKVRFCAVDGLHF